MPLDGVPTGCYWMSVCTEWWYAHHCGVHFMVVCTGAWYSLHGRMRWMSVDGGMHWMVEVISSTYHQHTIQCTPPSSAHHLPVHTTFQCTRPSSAHHHQCVSAFRSSSSPPALRTPPSAPAKHDHFLSTTAPVLTWPPHAWWTHRFHNQVVLEANYKRQLTCNRGQSVGFADGGAQWHGRVLLFL